MKAGKADARGDEKGGWVRTIGGVVGKVYAVKGENAILETSPDKGESDLL